MRIELKQAKVVFQYLPLKLRPHIQFVVRQCLRKISAEETVKECVTTFSRGAPTQACLSANSLLTCAIAPIQTECGEETSDWVIKYVTKFATAIDPRCKLASQLP
ncbi:hypothetical protein ANCDUO_18582, partial [Ancylostoma duodenale]